MSSEINLISFTDPPRPSPVTVRVTSSALAARVLAETGWSALEPDRPVTNNWTGQWVQVDRPANEGNGDGQSVETVSEQPVASGSSIIDRQRAPISSKVGSGETKSSTSLNSPSTIHHHDTPTSIAGKNVPLPDSPYSSLHDHSNSDVKHTHTSAVGKNIPLPESPFTPHRNDSDDRSITSDDTAQSRLSASARPFQATPTSAKRIEIVRTSEPPSFFPSPSGADADADETILQTPDVSADQMDPSYFAPGYGGHLTASSTSHTGGGMKSPVWFARPESRAVSITIPEPKTKAMPDVKVEEEETRPSTPITVKTYDGTADSPISDRVMREQTPKSPSEASSDLPPAEADQVSYYEGEDEDPRPLGLVDTDRIPGLDQLTAHFGSITLAPADEPTSVPPHDHPSSEGTSMAEGESPNPYEGKDGRLSPQLTGEQGDHDDLLERGESSDDIGHDTTLVSHEQSDLEGSAAEISDLEKAWMTFGDGYGRLKGSIDEALVRLKVELSYIDERLSASLPNGSDGTYATQIVEEANMSMSKSPEVRALRSQLQATRKKTKALLDEVESLKGVNEDLERSNEMLAAAAGRSAFELRVSKEEKIDLEDKFEHEKKRNDEIMGKYLRLKEDYDVLDARSRSDPRDDFVVVLLEGEGRLFDAGLLARGYEGGRIMATNLINSLGDLCKEVLDTDSSPKMNIQLYIDIKETVEELQNVNRIADEYTFQEFLSGFQLDDKLVSINLVKGQSGPGKAISKYAKFYASIPQCQMVIVGAGWNKPYKGLMEIESRLFVDKFFALRSTTRVDKDPFAALGNHKLLPSNQIFTTDIKDWMILVRGKGGNGDGGGGGGRGTGNGRGGPDGDEGGDRFTSVSSYSESSVATTRAASPSLQTKRQRSPSPADTPRAQRNETGRSNRLVSPESSPTARVPASQAPWATGYAPRARQVNNVPRQGGGGGSLLDQMLEAQSVSSRADSPDSDGTVGPGHHGIVIPINSSEGSVGGSPPSSDSDRPSVAVPHSAKKNVRRPINFASADRDEDTASEYSSVSAASTSDMTSFTAPTTRSIYQASLAKIVPSPRPVRPMASVPRGVPVGNNANTIPLGPRSSSGSTRPSEVSTSTFGGHRIQGSQSAASPAAKRQRELSIRGSASRS